MLVQTKPSFMGGDLDSFSGWIMQQACGESSAQEARIILDFVVEKDGTISNVKILKSNAPELVGKVIKAVTSSPKFEPGRNSSNKPVRTRCTIAVKGS